MLSREPAESLGVSSIDQLRGSLGMRSAQRLLTLSDEACSAFPAGARVVRLWLGPDTDELAVARQLELLPEVVWAQPDYLVSAEPLSVPISKQWYFGIGDPESCHEDPAPESCCDGCDIGVALPDGAWQYTRGHPSVIIAFFDAGADMMHPDLRDVYMVNPHEGQDPQYWEDRNGNLVGDLCDYPIGDLDEKDNDGNGVVDDVLLGWRAYAYGDTFRVGWEHVPIGEPHGTSVAGALGAITNNNLGVASVAGGDASQQRPGVRLIQFSHPEGWYNVYESAVDLSLYYAASYGARVYSSSTCMGITGDVIPDAVQELRNQMLIVQGVGNDDQTPMRCPMARLPGVMAVGGYDCDGDRWTIPDGVSERATWQGSDWGAELSLLGPTDDHVVYDDAHYERMVMASLEQTYVSPSCEPTSQDGDTCFGGTSAATPIVASIAALVLSYSEMPPYWTPKDVRQLLERTAEDIRCDEAADCECPSECLDLIGWDMYTGFGRVDAARAFALPAVVLDTLGTGDQLEPPPAELVFVVGETTTLRWRVLDLVPQNGWVDPEDEDAGFSLHYMRPEYGQDWIPITLDIDPAERSYDWVIPAEAIGANRRIRLTVVDSESNTNVEYSIPFWVVGSRADADEIWEVAGLVAAPNPSTGGAQISFILAVSQAVRVDLYDVAGRRVRSLVTGIQAAGSHSVAWDGRDERGNRVAPGTYFVRLKWPGGNSSARVLMLR